MWYTTPRIPKYLTHSIKQIPKIFTASKDTSSKWRKSDEYILIRRYQLLFFTVNSMSFGFFFRSLQAVLSLAKYYNVPTLNFYDPQKLSNKLMWSSTKILIGDLSAVCTISLWLCKIHISIGSSKHVDYWRRLWMKGKNELQNILSYFQTIRILIWLFESFLYRLC